MSDTRYVSGVAGVALVGSFSLIGIYAFKGQEPDPAVLTLITTIITGVLGYFFGSRGVTQGIEKATNGMSTMATQVAAQMTLHKDLERQAGEASNTPDSKGTQ